MVSARPCHLHRRPVPGSMTRAAVQGEKGPPSPPALEKRPRLVLNGTPRSLPIGTTTG